MVYDDQDDKIRIEFFLFHAFKKMSKIPTAKKRLKTFVFELEMVFGTE